MGNLLHSLYGRRLGTDRNGYVTSKVGFAPELQALTSGSTGTQIVAGGITTISASADQTFTLANPAEGALKTIMTISTAAGASTIRLTTDGPTFLSTNGSSMEAYVLENIGDKLVLQGLSTSFWAVLDNNSTAAPTT